MGLFDKKNHKCEIHFKKAIVLTDGGSEECCVISKLKTIDYGNSRGRSVYRIPEEYSGLKVRGILPLAISGSNECYYVNSLEFVCKKQYGSLYFEDPYAKFYPFKLTKISKQSDDVWNFGGSVPKQAVLVAKEPFGYPKYECLPPIGDSLPEIKNSTQFNDWFGHNNLRVLNEYSADGFVFSMFSMKLFLLEDLGSIIVEA